MKQIGESPVSMLYRREDHLGCRLTKMVDRCEAYVLFVMIYCNIMMFVMRGDVLSGNELSRDG
jgi:hypothetical protein